MKRHLSLTSLWAWHCACCLLALLACVPILWPQVFLPDAWEQRIISYAGWVVLLSFSASLLLIASTAFLLLLRLRNLRTLGYLLIWCVLWAVTGFMYCLLAWVADVPMPGAEHSDAEPIQRTDRLYIPEEFLTGPDSLVLPISPEHHIADTIQQAPHLTLLSEKHDDLLRTYVDGSPRWASYTTDDTFYTKPGHVVLVPTRQGGIPGLVHAAFRRLTEGDTLPVGYTIVKPGDPMPETPEGSEQVADLAVDLGKSHYLLLVWRGTSHAETAHCALNAALSTIDDMLAPLAEKPNLHTLHKVLTGKRHTHGTTPEILVSQPPAQYGTYQAEVHVNPREAGTLLLRIVNLEDNSTLRLFSCAAQYSNDPSELFRHDFPGFMPELMRAFSVGHVPNLLPQKAPLFIIRLGEPHQFFGVAFEIVFDPSEPGKATRTLLRRCYRVQAYEDPNTDLEEDKPAPAPAQDTPPADPKPAAAAPADSKQPRPAEKPTPAKQPATTVPAVRLIIPPPALLRERADDSLLPLLTPPGLNPMR